MSVLRSNRNKSVSHKLKRTIAFKGWRRHIGRREKIHLIESKKKTGHDIEI